jgi:hypothetical protein
VIFHDLRVLVHLLLHDEYTLMVSILDEVVLDVLIHHVETILHVVLCTPRHLLNDL